MNNAMEKTGESKVQKKKRAKSARVLDGTNLYRNLVGRMRALGFLFRGCIGEGVRGKGRGQGAKKKKDGQGKTDGEGEGLKQNVEAEETTRKCGEKKKGGGDGSLGCGQGEFRTYSMPRVSPCRRTKKKKKGVPQGKTARGRQIGGCEELFCEGSGRGSVGLKKAFPGCDCNRRRGPEQNQIIH